MIMQYRTIRDLSDLIRRNLWKIPHDIDLVVGVPRSGMLPASMIALYLNTKFTDLDSFVNGHIYNTGWTRADFLKKSDIHKVLVVDDSIYSGKSIEDVKEKLFVCEGYEFLFFAAFARSESVGKVDVFCEIIDEDRIFEWNLFHHSLLSYSCMDIDGVLCCDPEIDDDGPSYLNFLETAKPLFIPTSPVDTLISCRLEKYRKQTEEWLSKYSIRYNKLIMLDLPDKESRVKWGKHGEYKGEYYKGCSNSLFIESSYLQAFKIAQIAHKPVICLETNELIYDMSISEQCKNRLYKISPRLFLSLQKLYRRVKH